MTTIDNKMVMFILRVEYLDNTVVTLGNLQKINNYNFNDLFNIYKDILYWKDEEYKNRELKNLIFSYKIIPDTKLINNNPKLSIINKNRNKSTYKFMGWNLPNTIDFRLWGIIDKALTKNNIIIKDMNNKYYFNVKVYKDHNEIQLKTFNNVLITKFYDYPLDVNNITNFKRIINNHIYYYNNGELVLKTLNLKSKYLTNIETSKNIDTKFMTMDIETQVIDNVMIPYCICFYDGNNKISFYLNEYNSHEEMLKKALLFIMRRKYNGYKIYVHNLSNFDGIFIIKILSSIEDIYIKPVIKDDKIIELKIMFNKYNIIFRDSFLMLPTSLKALAKQFNVENKGLFPYNFVNNKFNDNINLSYSGNIPDYKYFTNITTSQYLDYKLDHNYKSWSLKEETINYCIQDCISLYQVICNFNSLIFDKYNLNIHRYPTLPSLTFGIYRAHYLKDYKIPLITGQIFNDLKLGYTGGSTDMFKPFGNNIFRYDVNSLYPYVMKNNPMPVGNIAFFEGNILEIDKNAFGFFKCEINATKDLKHPIIQTKFDTGNGTRTISPVGKWTDMIFSEEIYNAMKYGYSFKVLSGYTFDKEYIFNDYITDLYEIKKASNKDEPMYLISKLLMNSLYGRFGMDYRLLTHNIIDNDELYEYVENYDISNIIELDNNKSLISYLNQNKINYMLLNNEVKSNISISIAAGITAYSRIHMTQFKNNPNYELFYTDTDSIDINTPLPDHLVGKELGQMKLEYNFIEATFLAPKVYGGLYSDNNQLKSITKVKGFKNKLDYYELKSLLTKDNSLKLNQTKWFKNIENANISIKEQLYTLIPTDNKISFIYKNKILVNTKPFIINNDKIIDN
jgi:hypothetical protein